MEGLITGPLADALRRGRKGFNVRFTTASKAGSPIDAHHFQQHLTVAVDPIVRSVAAEFAERTDAVVDALFDLSLDLFGQSLLGAKARYPIIPEAWQHLLPRVPRFMAREPARVAGSITNALYNLSRTPGARPQAWAKSLLNLTASCAGITEFLDCGAILAWRCGMPQYRLSALAKSSALPAPLAARLLGTEAARVAEVIRNLAENPWITPQNSPSEAARELKLVARAGAFRGFAGQFLLPPKVVSVEGEIVAIDGDATWRLHADAYNALLLRCEVSPSVRSTSDAAIKSDGALKWRGQEHRFPELANATSIASTADTVAITLPTSHHLFLVAMA